ncbi:hypothetical protein [Parafrankia sp. EUN1f]|uniref:hypothetical protein n=1 Tax=Parafrankia sp. EUN1f TaxID=102897 RepID=UPI0001C43F8D|nr:hypothetical protein [Parafrankia sp. EUN1f]EFC79232.1 hypothetical protein FrEUN1fDRAFT_7648 [Parafrankia sp. EUN1f]
MRYALWGLALAGITLVGCASTEADGGTAVEPTAVAPAAQSTEEALITSPQGQAFISAFRSAYPQLSENRLDKHIVRNGSRVCSDITEAGKDVALKRLPLRIAYNNITPDAVTSQAIFTLAVQSFCPEKAG